MFSLILYIFSSLCISPPSSCVDQTGMRQRLNQQKKSRASDKFNGLMGVGRRRHFSDSEATFKANYWVAFNKKGTTLFTAGAQRESHCCRLILFLKFSRRNKNNTVWGGLQGEEGGSNKEVFIKAQLRF